MDAIAHWFSQLGAAGNVLFFLAYAVVTLVPVPTAPFTLAAGALFGWAMGLALTVAATMIGSTSAFLLGRHGFRRRVQRGVHKHPKLEAVDEALRDEGWKAVALLQMTPGIPFGVQNYFLGASKVGLRPYVIGTVLGALPSTAMYVIVGHLGRAAMADGGPAKWGLLALGIAATVVLVWRIGRAARR